MSLSAAYRKEREGVETLELTNGFITYKFLPGECYIVDIYVKPEVRNLGLASSLADRVAFLAQKRGLSLLTGSVDNRLPSAPQSEKVLIAYGMKKGRDEGPMTYFYKELT